MEIRLICHRQVSSGPHGIQRSSQGHPATIMLHTVDLDTVTDISTTNFFTESTCINSSGWLITYSHYHARKDENEMKIH